MNRLRGSLRGLPLTAREQEVLVAIVNSVPSGRSGHAHRTEAAAEALCVSRHTIRNELENAVEKLGARSTEHAVALAFPLLADRYLETPDRRRLAALAYDVLQRRRVA